MPKSLLLITKLIYSDVTCLATYITSAAIGTFFQDTFLQFISTLATLSLSSILVFYLKKWLERKDENINKEGGIVEFVKALLKNKSKK